MVGKRASEHVMSFHTLKASLRLDQSRESHEALHDLILLTYDFYRVGCVLGAILVSVTTALLGDILSSPPFSRALDWPGLHRACYGCQSSI